MARILVVEDEGIVALDICEELTALGYEIVGQASTGEEAINLAKSAKPDLIFMDINLQGAMDGVEAASIVSSMGVPVVFLTAHADETTLQRAKLTNPFGYIIKPFERDELRVAVELAFNRIDGSRKTPEEDEEWITPPTAEAESVEWREELLASLPMLHGVPREHIRTLAHAAQLKESNGGVLVVSEGEELGAGFVVISGRLSVLKSNEGGKELILELLSAGDATGLLMGVSPGGADYSVRAQVDSKILWVPIGTLRLVLRQNPDLYEVFLVHFAERTKRFAELALSLAHAKVEQRIIATLLALAPRFGKTTKEVDQVRLFLTRKDLADLTGTTPETAIRITKALEREGVLDLTRPGIIKVPSLNKLKGLLY